MPDDDKLTPADPSDLAHSISFALRVEGRKRFHWGDEFMANPTVNHIVRYLERAGYVVLKKQPALGAGDNPAGAVLRASANGSSPLRIPEGWPHALKDRLE
jgi:hypothetical protein